MDPLPKPEVILTHESDLDGFVSGLLLQQLAMRLFGKNVRLEAYHYQAWKNRDMRESSAWVCDFSFESRFDKQDWVVLDHHPTELTPKNCRLVHDVNKSAGLICYEVCKQHGICSPALDRIVHLNNVADLFLESDPDFVLANDYANLVKSYNFWNLYALIDGQLERLLDHPLLEVMAVKRRIEDPIGFEWSKRFVQEIAPGIGYVDTVVGNVNLIVHQLLDSKAVPHTILLTLFRKANNAIVVSLRSRNGEAIKVAEKLQGGGHPNACGATLPKSVRTIDDAIIYLKTILVGSKREQGLNSLESLFAAIENKK